MNVRNILMCLLSFCLLFAMNRVALAVDPYNFDQLWDSATWTVKGPDGVAKDSAQNFYVASGTDHRILKIASNGKILAQWGSFGAGIGQFNAPRNVAVDSVGGYVYVADSNNDRIQKFDTNGNYLAQWNGSDTPAAVTLNKPSGLALDSAGNVYVTEAGGNSRVLKFTSGGAYSGLVGTGTEGSGDGQFKSPRGVAVDSAGNIFVADTINYRIQKFDATGAYLTQWNSTDSGNTLVFPLAVAVDSSHGFVYVTDMTNFSSPVYRIQKFNTSGSWLARLTMSAGNTLLNYPTALALDSLASPNLYVADKNNNRIVKFSYTGTYVSPTIIGDSIVPIGPASIAVDDTRKFFYSTDITNNSILKYGLDGTFQTTWGVDGIANGQFKFGNGSGVAVDAAGNVYVADTDNNRIQKFNSNGTYITKWANDGGPSPTDFYFPGGVAVDASGYVYIADTYNARIVKRNGTTGAYITQWATYDSNNNVDYISPSGVAVDTAGNNVYVVYRDVNLIQQFTGNGDYVRQWGGTGSGDGQFSSPQSGLTVDSAGHVFVTDTGNNRIQKFAADGTFLAAWGTVGSAPGQFIIPYGVAADGAGNIYVADNGNSRIQQFTPVAQTLTVSVTGSGSVVSSPAGISTSTSQTSPPFNLDTAVTLTASPVSGGTFLVWGGDCSSCTNTTCLVTMNISKTCSASFATVYPLNVTIDGAGSGSVLVNPPGTLLTSGTQSFSYSSGTPVTLTAAPGNSLLNWTGCDSAAGNDCNVTIDAGREVTATFEPAPAKVKIDGDATPYYAIGTALDAITSANQTVRARNQLFIENVTMTTPYITWLKGGYTNDAFTTLDPINDTIIDGSLKIRSGTLKVDQVKVR